MINEMKWTLNEEITDDYLIKFFDENKELFEHTGGSIETFISKLKMAHSKRVFCLDKDVKFILTCEDIKNGIHMAKSHSEVVKKITYSYYT